MMKPRVKGSRDFELAKVDISDILVASPVEARMACVIAKNLGLPCWDDMATPETAYSLLKLLESQFEEDQDGWLARVVDFAGKNVSAIINELKQEYEKYKNTKWLQNDYGDIHEFIFEHIEETAYSSAPAIISLAAYWVTQPSKAFLIHIVPWFIRYGKQEDITNDDMMNRFANRHHDEYIIRLPSDELFEFLTSDKDSARVMAKNKVKASLLGDEDEES